MVEWGGSDVQRTLTDLPSAGVYCSICRGGLFPQPLRACSTHCQYTQIETALAAIVRLRLGMNQHAEQVRHLLPEPALQRGLNVVHPRQRKIVFHGAMQRQIEPSGHPLKHQVM